MSKSSRMEVFTEFYPNAIKIAKDYYDSWAANKTTYLDRDDFVQEALTKLWTLTDDVDMSENTGGQANRFVTKALQNTMRNITRDETRKKRTSVVEHNDPDILPSETDFGDSMDFLSVCPQDIRIFCKKIVRGHTKKEARKAAGWSHMVMKQKMVQIQKFMGELND